MKSHQRVSAALTVLAIGIVGLLLLPSALAGAAFPGANSLIASDSQGVSLLIISGEYYDIVSGLWSSLLHMAGMAMLIMVPPLIYDACRDAGAASMIRAAATIFRQEGTPEDHQLAAELEEDARRMTEGRRWPPPFIGVRDTPVVITLKRGRGAPDQPECDLSKIVFKLGRVHLFRAEYFVGRRAGARGR